MNKLEERYPKERFLKLVSAYCISFKEGDERAEKCVEITKEIAIGFKDWADTEVRSSYIYKGTTSKYFGLTDEQLFEMYLETLK
jgi:hypothetical protein